MAFYSRKVNRLEPSCATLLHFACAVHCCTWGHQVVHVLSNNTETLHAAVAQVAGCLHGLPAPPAPLFHALLSHPHCTVRSTALAALLEYGRKVPAGGFSCRALLPPGPQDARALFQRLQVRCCVTMLFVVLAWLPPDLVL